jgi:hypothetical protein
VGARRRALCGVGIATGILTIVGGTVAVLSPGFVRIAAVGLLLVGVGAIVAGFAVLAGGMSGVTASERTGWWLPDPEE